MSRPTNIREIHPDQQGATLRAAGYRAIVYAHHAYADKASGDIISMHKTRDAADRKARGSSMWAILDL